MLLSEILMYLDGHRGRVREEVTFDMCACALVYESKTTLQSKGYRRGGVVKATGRPRISWESGGVTQHRAQAHLPTWGRQDNSVCQH